MKRGLFCIVKNLQIPAVVSISAHAALLWFLALYLGNAAGRKSARSLAITVANFRPIRESSSINQTVTKVAAENQLEEVSTLKKVKTQTVAARGKKPRMVAAPGLDHPRTVRHNLSSKFRPVPELVNGDEVKVPYPERARQLMIEGVVRLRLTISEAGRVINVEVLSGPAFGLRNAALLVARKLFFLPATDERGQAKTAHVEHDVVFKLNKRS